MLKAEINEKTTSIEINGTLPQICIDLTRILSAINERLSKNDPEIGHQFRMMFTKGFMDGICFDDDREHMEHYLAEADQMEKKNKAKASDLAEILNDFIGWLKEKNDELEKLNKAFENAERKKDDEAE